MFYWVFAINRDSKEDSMECTITYGLTATTAKLQSYGEFNKDVMGTPSAVPPIKNGQVVEQQIRGAKRKDYKIQTKYKAFPKTKFIGGHFVVVVLDRLS